MPDAKAALSAAQLRALDKDAEAAGISIESLMENAGKAVADEAVKFLKAGGAQGRPWKILVICGSGNNGGDGFAAARFLKLSGAEAAVVLVKPAAKLKGAALSQYEKLRKAGIPLSEKQDGDIAPRGFDLLIDAILGTGFEGTVDGPVRNAIEAINESGIPVLAIDVPSGLNADSGKAQGACVRADKTVTLVAPKKGFAKPEAKQWTGVVVARDIGIPEKILKQYINVGG